MSDADNELVERVMIAATLNGRLSEHIHDHVKKAILYAMHEVRRVERQRCEKLIAECLSAVKAS